VPNFKYVIDNGIPNDENNKEGNVNQAEKIKTGHQKKREPIFFEKV